MSRILKYIMQFIKRWKDKLLKRKQVHFIRPVNDEFNWLQSKKRGFPSEYHINPSFISHIIIHHSLSDDGKEKNWGAIRRYHMNTNGWVDIGYHFGIEMIGDDFEVMYGRPLNKRGAHAKDGGFNNKSIGICVVGNWDDRPPPERQFSLAIELTKNLIQFYGSKNIPIRVDRVLGHGESQIKAGVKTPKSCPGKMFNMDLFRERLHNIG